MPLRLIPIAPLLTFKNIHGYFHQHHDLNHSFHELSNCRPVEDNGPRQGGVGPIGTGKRRLEIRRFTYPPGEIMHQIDMESHIGTHVEAPSHFVDARYRRKGKDIAQIPLERLFGEAVLVDLGGFNPRQALTPEHLNKIKVKNNDIVFIGNAKHDGEDRPYISKGRRGGLPKIRSRWLE